MTEQEGNVIIVECCAECPFVTPEPKCGEADVVEIDPETMDGDIPSACPMRNGVPRPNGDKWVKLAQWIMDAYPDHIDD